MTGPVPVTLAADLGAVIRGRRVALRMSQAELGALLDYTQSWVSRVEGNRLTPSWPDLVRLARLLGLSSEDLGAVSGAGAVAAGTMVPDARSRADLEDDVRRRSFLAGTAVAGATIATASPSAVAAGALPLEGLDDFLVLGPPPLAQEPTAAAARVAVANSRSEFLACRYARLACRLPERLALAQALGEEVGQAAEAQLWCVAARVAIKAGDDRVTAVAADRAVTAAARVSSPLVLAEAHRMVSSAHRRYGQHERATRVAVRAADALAAAKHADGPGMLSTQGRLLATAAYSAAKAGDGPAARELLQAAHAHARQLDRTAGRSAVEGGYFSSAHVCLHEVSVHHLLGDPATAISRARGIPATGLPRERLVRLRWETARAFALWGRDRECLAQLLGIERLSSEDIRRPAGRALALQLARRPRPVPDAMAFAHRVGAA